MFNKIKKPNEIRPISQKPKSKSVAAPKKDVANKQRDNKDTAQEKASMRSEGGKN